MSQYILVIYTTAIIFPIIAIFITLPILVVNYHRYGALPKWRIFILYTFVFYMMCAYFLTILPLPSRSFVAHLTTPTHNFIPFTFILEFFKYNPFALRHPGTWLAALKAPTVIQPAFNILLTVPFGFYLHYYFRRTWKQTVLLSFGLSLFFEITQLTGLYGIYPRPYRLFDVDDLMLNTLGGWLGVGLANGLSEILPTQESVQRRTMAKSQNVSAFRRLAALAVDWIIISIVSVPFDLMIKSSSVNRLITPILWLIFILLAEMIFQKTLGMRLVKINVINKHGGRANWYQLILRNFFAYGVIGGVFGADIYLLDLTGTAPMSQMGMIHLGILITSIILLFVMVDLLIDTFAKRHRLFFEHLSGTDTQGNA